MNANKLCLGTVQFGLKYGINNKTGKPRKEEVFEILDMAIKNGINFFDTATAYGEAEEILGQYIKQKNLGSKINVISKLRPQSDQNLEFEVQREVKNSLEQLNIDFLQGYLFHDMMEYYNEKKLSETMKLKQKGYIRNIGVSIYDFEVAKNIVKEGIIDYIQIPYNIFDQRAEYTGFFQLAKEKKITVFGRSAFLQGLLLMDQKQIPSNISEAYPYMQEWEMICREFSIDKLSLALLFSYLNKNIKFIVFGVETQEQLIKNISIIKDPFLINQAEKAIPTIKKRFMEVEEKVILPFRW